MGKFSAEDLIPSEQVVIILTRGNYIKRMPVTSYRSQIRGGKGIMGMGTKEEDMIEHLVAANTHDDVYFFTDRGRIFHTKVYEIPAASRIAKGQAIVNILQISPEEKVTAMITLGSKDFEKYKFILLATSKGLVKKTEMRLYTKVRKTGILAIKLKNEDRLRWVKFTNGQSNVFQVSSKGQSIYYQESDIRPMGRTAAGVRGILLKGEDYVVSTDVILTGQEQTADALIVMEKGFGKRTPLPMFKTQIRGGMGLRAAQVTSRTGPIVGMRIVYGDDYDVILASSKGQMIRLPLGTIKKLQRDTQGVTLIRLNSGDKVTSVTVIRKDKTDKLADIPEEPKGPEEPFDNDEIKMTDDEQNIEDKIPDVKTKKSKKQTVKNESAASTSRVAEAGLPSWAKVHTDTWRQPDIFKPRKNIKVKNYQEEKIKKELPLTLPKSKEESETNYWGGKL